MHAQDGLRIAILIGSVVAALGSASSQQQQAPSQQPTYPTQPAQQAGYSPCEYACGQLARCNLAPYDACLGQCRQEGTEQKPGGPEHLATVSRSTCEQLGTALAAAAGTAQPQGTQATQSATTAQAGSIELDYSVPTGYTATSYATGVVFTPSPNDARTPCTYGVGNARTSSGSLDRDAAAALLEPLAGWQRKDDRSSAMQGTSAAGWKYYWLRADAMRPGQSYEYASVMAMALQGAGGRTLIVWGYGNPARCLFDDASFARLFHGLRPRGWTSDAGQAIARDLEGLWRTSQSAGVAQIQFKRGGRYERALNTTAQIGVSERTSTGVHEGTYTLRDGVLELVPDRKERGTEKLRVRVYDEFTTGRWTRALALFDDRPDATSEIIYYRVEAK